jgi:hypothetical protein
MAIWDISIEEVFVKMQLEGIRRLGLAASFCLLAASAGCDSAPEFVDETSLHLAQEKAEERLALAKARESDSYASRGLGVKSLDASSAVHEAQREVDRLHRATVNPHLSPLKNPDSSMKEQADSVRYEIEKSLQVRRAQELVEDEHILYLRQAKSPQEILTTAKWMLENSIKKEEKSRDGWYRPKGTGYELAKKGYSETKESKNSLMQEFKEKIARRQAMLDRVDFLLGQAGTPETKK